MSLSAVPPACAEEDVEAAIKSAESFASETSNRYKRGRFRETEFSSRRGRAQGPPGPVFENQAAATSVPHGLDSRVLNRNDQYRKKRKIICVFAEVRLGGSVDALVRKQTGEFDPGSERTLAAGLTHASRTLPDFGPHGRVANG